MHITFLEHSAPLTKIFSNNGTTPYPNAKNFTSHTHEISSIRDLYAHIENHAEQNHCLLKGGLSEPLNNESRAGKGQKHEPNQIFLLDIDGLELPNTQVSIPVTEANLRSYANTIISYLPQQFHNVSYITQASASFGLKGNKISLHIFFMLDHPVDPKTQKDILTHLNFMVPEFETKLQLTPSGKSLRFPIDICMAQNTRIVYIAPPMFHDNTADPIKQRLILVEKTEPEANLLSLIMEAKPAVNQNAINTKTNALRRQQGLQKEAGQFKTFTYDGDQVELLINPDRCNITMAYENGDFAYFNINGGDSNAYYTTISNPYNVYNFKGEPAFPMHLADPDFYEWFLDTYAERIFDSTQLVPFVFRDFRTGIHWNGLYHEDSLILENVFPASKGDLAEFMIQHNHVLPVPIPTWDFRFTPNSTRGLNIEEGWVNRLKPTEYILCDETLEIENLGYKTGAKLQTICPVLFKTINHLMNESEQELLHFINWLCVIIKHRIKTKTAWILSGVQGTGKGVLFHNALRPILGEQAFYANTKTIEDQFNDWLTCNVLFCLDEFKLDDARNSSKLNAFIKSLITEPTVMARKMRTDPYNVVSHSNCLMFSNQFDVQKIEPTDRRFNVAPRQETPINRKYPNFTDDVSDILPNELMNFVRFANTYATDIKLASLALSNDAKAKMYKVTENTIEAFAIALREGNLDYFVTNILEFEATHPMDDINLRPAKQIVKVWLDSIDTKSQGIHVSDLVIIHNAISTSQFKPAKLKSMLQHYGIPTPTRIKLNNKKRDGWKVAWKLHNYKKDQLIEEHFTTIDSQYLNVSPIKPAAA